MKLRGIALAFVLVGSAVCAAVADKARPSIYAAVIDFEIPGAKGWDAPDNAGAFVESDPRGSGKVLRIRTDIERDKKNFDRSEELGKEELRKRAEAAKKRR